MIVAWGTCSITKVDLSLLGEVREVVWVDRVCGVHGHEMSQR